MISGRGSNVAPFVYGITMAVVLLFLRKGVVPSLRTAFANSCNSVFAPLGVEVGAERERADRLGAVEVLAHAVHDACLDQIDDALKSLVAFDDKGASWLQKIKPIANCRAPCATNMPSTLLSLAPSARRRPISCRLRNEARETQYTDFPMPEGWPQHPGHDGEEPLAGLFAVGRVLLQGLADLAAVVVDEECAGRGHGGGRAHCRAAAPH